MRMNNRRPLEVAHDDAGAEPSLSSLFTSLICAPPTDADRPDAASSLRRPAAPTLPRLPPAATSRFAKALSAHRSLRSSQSGVSRELSFDS